MPVSYNSPARNFFLLASTGQQEITAFIKRIITPSSSDTFGYEPARIEYVESDQKYLVSGTQSDGQDDQLPEGYLVKTTENDTRDFDLKIQSTVSAVDRGTTIRSIAQDSNENIIICGRFDIRLFQNGGSPYVGKFDLNGNNLWYASTTESSVNWDIEYTDIAIDANDNIFVVGYDSKNGDDGTIISRYTPDGAVIWSKKIQDIGSDGFVDIRGSSISVNNRNELVVAGSLEGITREKGFVAKYDLNGNQIWLKTFEDKELASNSSYRQVVFNSTHVDGNGYIYCAGYSEDAITSEYRGVVLRLSPEGNLVWQNKTNYSDSITYTSVSADTLTGQTIVAGDVWTGSEGFTVIQRFNAAGKLSWTRKLSSTNARSAFVNITSDPSYYYITYADETQQASDPESFLYGKLSITGNGLGTFAYADGVLDQDYVVTTIPIKTGTLFDGSIRNDNSDFVTYPHSATKILFDDLTMIYQPKQPVYDGSDHDIVNDNMLTADDITVLADNTSIIDTSSFVYIHGTTGGTGAGQVGGFDLGGTYHLRFGSLNLAEHQSAGYDGTQESLSISRKFDTFPIDLRQVASVSFETIRGTDTNGGEDPDNTNENLRLYYSIDGGNTFAFVNNIRTYNSTQVGNALYINTVFLPNAAKTNSTILRVQQDDHNGTTWDHWGITQFTLVGDVVSTPYAPKISNDSIVYGSNLLLNYDFGNIGTYDKAHNLIESSEDFTGIGWGNTFVSVVPNVAIAPDGTMTADKIVEDTNNAFHFVSNNEGIGAEPVVWSCYLKAAERTQGSLLLTQGGNNGAIFNLDTGTIASVFGAGNTAEIQDVGGGWYRCIVKNDGAADMYNDVRVGPVNGSVTNYQGDGNSGIYVWGAQYERGIEVSRYIKTSGTAITAPTTVKNLSSSAYTGTINGGTTFNSSGYFDFDGVDGYIDTQLNAGSVTELTVEAWLRVDTYTNDGAGISIGDTATSTGQCYLGRGTSGGDSIDWRFYTGTFLDETEFFTSDTGWKHYIGTYDQSGGAGSNQGRMILYVDGVQQDVALSNNTSAINFAGGTNIRIGTDTNSGATSFFDGKFGEVRIYNRALSATEVSQNFNATRSKYGV